MIDEKLLIRAAREFRGCIECSANHLTSVTYFHTKTCLRGRGLSSEVLLQRILERVAYLEAHEPRSLWKVPTSRCLHCTKPSTGTTWTRYHGYAHILAQYPVCEEHSALEDDSGRESGYIPGKAFETIFDVEDYLGDPQ